MNCDKNVSLCTNCMEGYRKQDICKACMKGCKKCDTNVRTCDACLEGFYMRNKLCI